MRSIAGTSSQTYTTSIASTSSQRLVESGRGGVHMALRGRSCQYSLESVFSELLLSCISKIDSASTRDCKKRCQECSYAVLPVS